MTDIPFIKLSARYFRSNLPENPLTVPQNSILVEHPFSVAELLRRTKASPYAFSASSVALENQGQREIYENTLKIRDGFCNLMKSGNQGSRKTDDRRWTTG